MRKILIFIIMILLFSCQIIFTETIKTKYGDKEIIVPENQNELKEAYLKTMKNYIEAEGDLKEIITMNQKLSFRINELSISLESTDQKAKELIKLLESRPIDKISLFIPYTVVGLGYLPFEKSMSGKIGVGVAVWEKIMLGLDVSFPDLSINLSVGVFLK